MKQTNSFYKKAKSSLTQEEQVILKYLDYFLLCVLWRFWKEKINGSLLKVLSKIFLATLLTNIVPTAEKEKTHTILLVAHSVSYSLDDVTVWLPKRKAST